MQTQQDVYPFGGDARYLISADGSKILERRQLHKTILEFAASAEARMGFHVAVLDDVPEDTDVLLVLNRRPRVALDTFVGYAPQLEDAILPQVDDVMRAII